MPEKKTASSPEPAWLCFFAGPPPQPVSLNDRRARGDPMAKNPEAATHMGVSRALACSSDRAQRTKMPTNRTYWIDSHAKLGKPNVGSANADHPGLLRL